MPKKASGSLEDDWVNRQRRKHAATARVEVTLRGMRFTDHPRNPAEVRGTVVEWERLGRAATAGAYDEDGRSMDLPCLSKRWNERERRVARRASQRRWRRMIEDGAFDVTERFEKARRDARRSLAVSLIPVGVAVGMGSMMIRGGREAWSATLPGLAWVEWVLAMLIGVMVLAYGAAMLLPSLAIVRTDVVRARATAEWVEIERPGGEGRRWSWSQLRGVRRRGFGTCATLGFDDGEGFSVHLGRLRSVIEWQAARISGAPARVRWSGPVLFVLVMQVAGVVMAWGVTRAPEMLGPRSAWETYAAISLLGVFFGGIVWWSRRLDVKDARRSRPRRVARAAGDSAGG